MSSGRGILNGAAVDTAEGMEGAAERIGTEPKHYKWYRLCKEVLRES